jgi:hypothetical protein
VDRPPAAAVDTADRPAAVAMVDLRVAARLLVVVDMADRLLVAAATAGLRRVDLRPAVTVDLRKVDLRATAGLLATADPRAHRPACISLRASAVRWAPAATCLR